MKIAILAVQRPVTTLMFIASLMLLGIISWQNLPVQLFPDLVLPQMGIYAGYSFSVRQSQTPSEVEEKLTIPIENIVAGLPGVKEISSSTWQGGCWTWVKMDFATDMRFVFIDLQEKLELLRKKFPRGTMQYRLIRIDTSEFQQRDFMHLVIKGSDEWAQIRAVALDTIQQRLEDIPGVSRVEIGGFGRNRVRILIDQNRLKEYRLPFSTVVQQVHSWSNPDVYLGQFETAREIYYVRIAGRYEHLDDLSQVPLSSSQNVKVGDVSEVAPGNYHEDMDWIYRFEGRSAIGINVEKEALANPIVTARRVRQELERLKPLLPPGYEIAVRHDSSEVIDKAIKGVTKLALIGAGVAMVVLLLFLRNLRATLIVVLSIPVSIISTFNLMYFAGFSFNLFTLVGLAFGIGMLVDNSIVVLENIFRHYHLTHDRRLAALRGTQEVARPILASTLTTVIVFVPILFVSDEIRLIFKEMALSIVFPIIMSLVVAYTFVPMATSVLLTRRSTPLGLRRWLRFLRWIPFYRLAAVVPRTYRRTLKPLLRQPMQTILIIALLILYAWSIRHRVQEGYLERDIDDEWLSLYVTLPKGTKTIATSRVSQQVEEMLTGYEEIDQFGARIQNETSNIWIRLKERGERKKTRDELLEEILERTRELPGANVSRYPPSEERPSEVYIPYGGGGSIEIRGSNQEQLLYLANLIINRLQTIPGIRDAQSDITQGQPELRLLIDRQKAALFQVSPVQIAQAVESQRKGGQLAEVKLRQGEEEVDIIFEMQAEASRVVEDLRLVPVFTGSGITVPLGELCRLELGTTSGNIRRENQERVVNVHYRLLPDQNLQKINEEVKQQLKAMRIPAGTTVRAEQERRDIDVLQQNLKRIVLLGVILIFMVLASLFESLGAPFVVLLSLPLAILGTVYGLIVMKNPFDVFGAMGVIVLVGIVVNNAILLLHFVTLKRRQFGWRRSRAILVSCRTRFRPIWMTTLTTIVGLVPLAMKTSEKSIWTPFGVVVIGGLLGSTILTPYVIPAMYVLLENRWLMLKKRFFWLLSWRWVFIFWNRQLRQDLRQKYQRGFLERFGPLRLSRQVLQTMPLRIVTRHLTMVYPEKRGSAGQPLRRWLSWFKNEVLLPAPQVGIIPAGHRWLRSVTEETQDPRKRPYGFKALDDINLEIGPGMFGLLGPNGAGKTTLIRILATILPASRGEVTIGGYDIRQHRQDLAREIGYLPQSFGFYERFTPRQYLNQMAIMKGLRRARERRDAIERVLRQVNLWTERDNPIGHFSGGMKQRLGIAQTLLTLPRMIIVDEPTAGLDPQERVNFRNLLAELSRERIVILSTHIVEDISSSCNRVGIMDQGRLIFVASLEELLSVARGKVWEGVYDPASAEGIQKMYPVISQTVVAGGKRIRFLSEIPPGPPAAPAEPELEDAYVYVRRAHAEQR